MTGGYFFWVFSTIAFSVFLRVHISSGCVARVNPLTSIECVHVCFLWKANSMGSLSDLKNLSSLLISQLSRQACFQGLPPVRTDLHFCDKAHLRCFGKRANVPVCLLLIIFSPSLSLSCRTPLDTTCPCTAASSASRMRGQGRARGGC